MKESKTTPSELTELLRNAPIGVPTPHEMAEEEARLVPWLEERIAEVPLLRVEATKKARRRTAVWVGVSALALAAGVLLVVRLTPFGETREIEAKLPEMPKHSELGERGAVLVQGEVESGPAKVLVGSRLGLVSGVRTKTNQEAKLLADDGYTLALGEASSLRLLSLESAAKTELLLEGGSVELSVPKLGSERSLSVRAADTVVVVHGTKFFVGFRANARGAPSVCTRVSEGKVEVLVRGETVTYLGPGEKYGCDDEVVTKAAETSPRGRSKSSSLAEENALLAKALAAERRGELREAERAYRALLDRYPGSGFLPEARAGLARLAASRKP